MKNASTAFSRIRTEYSDSVSLSIHLSVFSPNVGKCGKNVDKNNSKYGLFLRSEGYKILFSTKKWFWERYEKSIMIKETYSKAKYKQLGYVEVGLSTSKKNLFYFLQWKPWWKMMKNVFYFILKALFVLKIFKFLSGLFSHKEKTAWFRNIRLISKFMTSQPC